MREAGTAEAKPQNADAVVFDRVMEKLGPDAVKDGAMKMIISHLFVLRVLFRRGFSIEEVCDWLSMLADKATSIREALKTEKALQPVPVATETNEDMC